jgi:hypothetical protein
MSDSRAILHQAHELAQRARLQVVTRRGQDGRVHAYRVFRVVDGQRRTYVGERGSAEATLALVKRAAGSVAAP